MLSGRTRLSWISNDGSPGDPCAPEPGSDASIGRAPADGSVIQPQLRYLASHCPTYRQISHLNRTCLSRLFQDIDFLRIVQGFDSHHPLHSQASRGNGGGGKYLTASENSWVLRTNSGPDHCARLPLTAPAFARGAALGLRLIKFQVRIGGRDRHPSALRQPPCQDRMRHGISAVSHKETFLRPR